MKNINTIQEVIRFSDCDAAGILYFSRFASFFDEGVIDIMRREGMSWEKRGEEKLNFLIPVVETRSFFHSPLSPGDTITVYTAFTEIGNKFFKSSHLITKQVENREIANTTGYISRVTVDFKKFTSKSIPIELRDILEKNYVEPSEWDKFTDKFLRH